MRYLLPSVLLLFLIGSLFASFPSTAVLGVTYGNGSGFGGGAYGVNGTTNTGASAATKLIITKDSYSTSTEVGIYLQNGTQIANASFSGVNATFSPFNLSDNTKYYFGCTKGGASQDLGFKGSGVSYPVTSTYWNYSSGVNNGAYIADAAYCVISVTFDQTLYSNLTVLSNSSAGGTAIGNASLFVVPANKSINATANTNYTFMNWSISSGTCTVTSTTSANSNAQVLVSTNCVVQPNFAMLGNLSVNAGTGGSATGNTSNAELPKNLTINATAAAYYVFANWSVTSGICTVANSTNPNTQVLLSNPTNCVVQANFAAYGNLTVSAGTGGTATGNATSLFLPANSSLNATPSAGYLFHSWLLLNNGNCTIANTTNQNTQAQLNLGNCSVQANFIRTATWNNTAEPYRKIINLTNWSCSAATCQFAVYVELNKSLSNGTDLFITDATDSAALPFARLDDWNYTNSSGYVLISAANNSVAGFAYYGANSSVNDSSSIDAASSNRFCSDLFTSRYNVTSAYNGSKWSSASPGAYDVINGELVMSSISGTYTAKVTSPSCSITSSSIFVKFRSAFADANSQLYVVFNLSTSDNTLGNMYSRIYGNTNLTTLLFGSSGNSSDISSAFGTNYIVRFSNPAAGNATMYLYYASNHSLAGSFSNPPLNRNIAANFFQYASGTGYIDYSYSTAQSDYVATAAMGTQEVHSLLGNLSVNSTIGGNATGNASNFAIPANRTINATPNFGFLFQNWSVLSGNCTLINATAANSTVQVNSETWCFVQANFVAVQSVSIAALSPTAGLYTPNKTINYTLVLNSTPSSYNTTILIYMDGALISNTTANTNATVTYLLAATYGSHSWYAYAFNTANASMNATTANTTFEVNFGVTALAPANGSSLSGAEATLFFNTSNLYPINCTTYLDSIAIDNRQVNSSSTVGILATIAAGSHNWNASCAAGDNAGYVQNTSTFGFSISTTTFNYSLNLTSGPENVLAAPQLIFYDLSGNLNVLYFTDEGTSRTLRIKTIANNAVTCAANATLEPTSSYYLALREQNQTVLLSFNATSSTTAYLMNFSSCNISIGTAAFPFTNALPNSNYDAYAYAYTKQYSTLNLTASSYYLFSVPLTNGSDLFRKNVGGSVLTQIGSQMANGFSPVWQTMANSSDLSKWYYLYGNASGIYLGYYNSTTQTILLPVDSQGYTGADMNASYGIFESFSGSSYVMLANLNRTTILQINSGLNLTLNETIAQPSGFFFVDANTFLFFNSINNSTNAYSCYFVGSANCTKFSALEYGMVVPYDRGAMTTSKLDGSSNVVAKGQISSGANVQLNYNLNTYDAKYLCYDEMSEARKLFTVQIYTNTTANILQNASWGYVIPSSQLGAGLKKSYFTCTNGTQRLFLSGLGANFTINAYSLNSTLGAYYTFTITDAFGQTIQGAQISAYRFSNSQQAFVTIEQGLTDSQGNAVLFLEPFTLYKITVVQAGYLTMNFDYQPNAVTSVTIKLSNSNAPMHLPNFAYLWDGVSYSLTPNISFSQNSTNVSYQVNAANATLEYFGMTITQTFPNGTSAVVYSNNLSSSPSGGILSHNLNSSGTYIVDTWFKNQNFSLFTPTSKYLTLRFTNSSFLQARDVFNNTQPITGWAFYLLAIIVAMLSAGFVNKYLAPGSTPGAGIAALAVLWGFSLFNPSVPLVCAAGLGGVCITPVIATGFTTIAVLSAIYIMGRY